MIGMDIMVKKVLMDLKDCFVLEDMFPKSFADYEERPYGIMFLTRIIKIPMIQITRLFTATK